MERGLNYHFISLACGKLKFFGKRKTRKNKKMWKINNYVLSETDFLMRHFNMRFNKLFYTPYVGELR